MSADLVEVRISRSLYERILERIGRAKEFKTADEYVTFVLEQILGEEAAKERTYSPQEEDQIADRLRRLGYL